MPFSEEYKRLLRESGKTEAQIAAMEAAQASGDSTKSDKPTDISYPSVSSKTQADSKITDVFEKLLDRSPTAAELKTWRNKLTDAQREFAARQTYKKTGTKATQETVGGLDTDYWLTTELSKDPVFGPEIQRLSSLDSKVRQKQRDKKEYENALKAAGNNASAVTALQQNTAYGLSIKALKDRISSQADAAGATLDETSLLQIAQEAYDTNQDQDTVTFNKFINSKLNLGPTGGQYKGEAAGNYQRLFELGIENGINIETDPRFKGKINTWLNQVNAGVPIANFETEIRSGAAENQPAFVQSLLKTGRTLRQIYGNYIGRMAKFFNVDESTIDINDPLLKNVFSDTGGVPFNEFEANLMNDPRLSKAEKGTKLTNRQYLLDRALELGVELADTDVDDILTTAFSLDLNPNSPEIDKLIRSRFNYAPGKAFGGRAGQAVIDLRQTAAANGIDLDAQFGGQLDGWIEKVLQGENVDTFKNLIRSTAKIGLPENVGKLLDEGVDLDTVYSPYKNLMASVLEINPATIKLSDPVLRSAISSEGEMSLYDYQRMLRKDSRWQYTKQARDTVASSVLQVLRDFGFQG